MAFVRTVLEHRGLFRQPSSDEFEAALAELHRYRGQCLDNPRERDAWEPELAEESLAELRAKVFVMFGVTKPSPAQWHKALFAACETCANVMASRRAPESSLPGRPRKSARDALAGRELVLATTVANPSRRTAELERVASR
jgi:hypothetical protein